MKQLICDFLRENGYPQEAEDTLLTAYEKLGSDRRFTAMQQQFCQQEDFNPDKPDSPLDLLCREAGVHFYTGKLLFYICLTPILHKQYREAGLSEEMYRSAIEDIHTKARECVEVYGFWGIFSPGWLYSVFHMKTLGIGRFFFNFGEYKGEDMTIGGRTVTQGDRYLSVHIPSSGKPFDRETRLASYDMAYHFYKPCFEGKEPLFRCGSWLLNPDNRRLLGEKSNIVSFMDDFRMIASFDNPDNSGLWRVFGAAHQLPPQQLPRDTSLRRAYADYLAAGHNFGGGIGFFVYDPVSRTTLK